MKNVKNNPFMIVLCSICWAFLFSASCLLVLTYLVYQFEFQTQLADAAILLIYIASNLLSGMFIGYQIHIHRIIYSIFAGLIYVLILQLFSMLITGIGILDIGAAQISTGILCVTANLMGSIIGKEPRENAD